MRDGIGTDMSSGIGAPRAMRLPGPPLLVARKESAEVGTHAQDLSADLSDPSSADGSMATAKATGPVTGPVNAAGVLGRGQASCASTTPSSRPATRR